MLQFKISFPDFPENFVSFIFYGPRNISVFVQVLVEESPVPQMALLQSNSSPVFKLVTNVLNQVYNDTINSGKFAIMPLFTVTQSVDYVDHYVKFLLIYLTI